MSLLFPSDLFNQQSSLFSPSLRGLFSENSYMDSQMDWKETPHAHIFEFDLPGLTKEDVRLEVHEDRILHIRAERRDEEPEEKGHKWHCRERNHGGSFMRRFRLPDNSKVDEIKASMRDGVLTVIMPLKDELIKKKKSNKHKSSVEISGDEDDAHAHAPKAKGLGIFACCKA